MNSHKLIYSNACKKEYKCQTKSSLDAKKKRKKKHFRKHLLKLFVKTSFHWEQYSTRMFTSFKIIYYRIEINYRSSLKAAVSQLNDKKVESETIKVIFCRANRGGG